MKHPSEIAARWILASLALLLAVEPAEAQVAGANNQAAALAVLPWDVGTGGWTDGRVTEIVVSNGGPAPTPPTRMRLHVVLITPDFNFLNFVCPVIPNKATSFVFDRNLTTDAPQVRYSCTNPVTLTPGPETTRVLPASSGIFFVSHETFTPGVPGGATSGVNTLISNSTVIDFEQGSAYSFDAIHFLSLGAVNGDRLYAFPGEFQAFPASLATNFISPTQEGTTPGVTASLILFTIDGTLGLPSPRAAVTALAFDETALATGFGVINMPTAIVTVDLAAVFPGTVSPPSTLSGSLLLTPGPAQVSRAADAFHDILGGNGNGTRLTPVHGWLVQTAPSWTLVPGSPPSGGNRLGGPVAWARALDTGALPIPTGGDPFKYFSAPCVSSGLAAFPCLP